MNIYQALSASYSLLITKSKTYKLDCEILLADTLHIENRLNLFSNLNKNLSSYEKLQVNFTSFLLFLIQNWVENMPIKENLTFD